VFSFKVLLEKFDKNGLNQTSLFIDSLGNDLKIESYTFAEPEKMLIEGNNYSIREGDSEVITEAQKVFEGYLKKILKEKEKLGIEYNPEKERKERIKKGLESLK
jgi:hypothetical protein